MSGWDEDKEIYVDFILKSNSIINIQLWLNFQCKQLDPLEYDGQV